MVVVDFFWQPHGVLIAKRLPLAGAAPAKSAQAVFAARARPEMVAGNLGV